MLRTAGKALAGIGIAGLVVVASLRWIDPVTSSVILRENLFGAADSRWISFDWRPLERISAPMAAAVIAAEDQRFFRHSGLDFVELSKTLRAGKSRPRGASTITQQVAKNLFLWSGRSYARKILEAGLAIYIDSFWGKRRVLEIYLNIAQFGPAVYGVENAARRFFGKPAARLSRYEAARLAAVLPNPNLRSAAHPSELVLQRQRWILAQMRTLEDAKLIDDLL